MRSSKMSDQANIINLQQTVKNNAEELQDFLRDLDNWNREISAKDDSLRMKHNKGQGMTSRNPITLPTIRKQFKESPVGKKPRKNDSGVRSLQKDAPKRLSSYDYEAWDKFDVEEACAKVDESNDIVSTAGENDSNAEEFDEAQKKEQAFMEKEKGNEFLKNGKLDEAINCYTRGMLCDPSNALLPANRAMTFLRKQQYDAAEEDCNCCIALDSTYVKAYQRRASARRALGKISEAIEDVTKVLSFEPGNKQAAAHLIELRSELEMKNQQKSHQSTEIPETKPGNVVDNCTEKKDVFLHPVVKPSHLQSKKPLVRIIIEDDFYDKLEEQEVKPPCGLNDVKPVNVPQLPPVPCTSFQFLCDWRQIRSHREILYQYIKKIPPVKYPILFQQSMESSVLSDMLNIFMDFYLRDDIDVYEPLYALTKIQRFRTLVMFMTKDDKKVISNLIDHLQKNSTLEQIDTNKLAELYEL